MRGHDALQNSWFSYVSLEERIPKQHPLRRLRLLVDGVLASMDAVFAERYSHTGRPSIAPEKLLRALLLQVIYNPPQRTAVDGTIGLQPAVSLVCRSGY